MLQTLLGALLEVFLEIMTRCYVSGATRKIQNVEAIHRLLSCQCHLPRNTHGFAIGPVDTPGSVLLDFNIKFLQ